MDKLKFDVYYRNDKTGRVELDGNELILNECYLPKDTKFPFVFYPFVYANTAYWVRSMLCDRVFPIERWDSLKAVYAKVGVYEYDVYKILEQTHGLMYDDCIWFKFDHLKGDRNLTYDGIKIRD